jgi:hypothetical protein
MTDRETVTTPSIEPTRAVMPERERVRMEDGFTRGGITAFHGFIVRAEVPDDAMPYLTDSVRPHTADEKPLVMAMAGMIMDRIQSSTTCAQHPPDGTVGVEHALRPLMEYGNENIVVEYDDGMFMVYVQRDGNLIAMVRPQVLTHEPVMHDGRQLGTVAHTPDLDIHGRTWGTGADPMGLRITTPYDGTEGTQAVVRPVGL